ncbi:Uma2 family endonuclease [Cyanobacteria bacterium FACHB-63]|nr:Uma2 family endonuclease [Cyanobacteria bacterium FACHB-63]
MSIATKQKLTFDQFLEQYSDDGQYELVDGVVVEMRATRQHDDANFFILFAFNDEIRRLKLDYVVNNTTVIQTAENRGRKPDVSVVNKTMWHSERNAYGALDKPIQLAVEIVSTNWEDDYIDKLDEYQQMGISEYWIVDYLAIGSRTYLGNPKTPTVLVYLLDESGVYQSTAFKGDDRILSRTFPELTLTLNQILNA